MVSGLPHPIPPLITGYEKKYRLSTYFNQWWDEYVQYPQSYIYPEQYKAVRAMRACRTASLGVDHYVCDHCGEITPVYHSCKNRFCPTCSWKDTLNWADKMKDQLLPIAHRHVVFTLPHQLNGLLNRNKRTLLDFLFRSAGETLKDWMQHKYHLTPGIISVLHTFGEKKELHPHIHMILSWGGITAQGKIESIKGEYVPYEFLQTKFRCKFEDKLVALYDSTHLSHDFPDRISFLRFVKTINEKNWRIHFEPAMPIPSQVIRYIGRYSKRACLSEYKITNIEGEYITFRYKDYKHVDYYGKPLEKELTLHYREFYPRLLQHVPLPYFRLVRYYGTYAARTKAVLAPQMQVSSQSESHQAPADAFDQSNNPLICQVCHCEKTYLHTTFESPTGEISYMSRFAPKEQYEKHKQIIA